MYVRLFESASSATVTLKDSTFNCRNDETVDMIDPKSIAPSVKVRVLLSAHM